MTELPDTSQRALGLARRVETMIAAEADSRVHEALTELRSFLQDLGGAMSPTPAAHAVAPNHETDKLDKLLESASAVAAEWESRFESVGYPTHLVIDGWNVLARAAVGQMTDAEAARLVGMSASVRARLKCETISLFESDTYPSWDERSDGVWVGRLTSPSIYEALSEHLRKLEAPRVYVISADSMLRRETEHRLYDKTMSGLAFEGDAQLFYSYLTALNWLDCQESLAASGRCANPDADAASEFWFERYSDSAARNHSARASETPKRQGRARRRKVTLGEHLVTKDVEALKSLDNWARGDNLPRGANAITRELKDLWLSGDE